MKDRKLREVTRRRKVLRKKRMAMDKKIQAIIEERVGTPLDQLRVEENEKRVYPSKFEGFNESVLEGARKAGHIILWSGMDDDGDQAILMRIDGSLLGIEGPINAAKYAANPTGYKTPNPSWYGWGSRYLS